MAIMAAIIVLSAGGLSGYLYWQKAGEDKFLSSNQQIREAYKTVKIRQEQLREDKNNYDVYMSLAFHWKSIGEATKDSKYLWRSAKVYDEVIRKWGSKAYLPFLNQANVYILLKEYARAESNLKIALEIDPGEQSLYVALADLYGTFMKKDSKAVRAVYEQGIKTVVGGGNLVVNYASYLNELGEYKEALKYYKMLEQAYPTNPAYLPIIKELESKI